MGQNAQKMKNFFKKKILTKNFGFAAFGFASLAIVSGAIAYKYSHPFKPNFYNYRSYMSDRAVNEFSKKFDFKEFDTIDQFSNLILNNKVAAGIGSDAQAVELIKKNALEPIGYWEKIGKSAEDMLTPEVFNHLKNYDEILKTDEFGTPWENRLDLPENERKPKHLYDYFVPYFSQDMVLAYNPSKVFKTWKNDEDLKKKTWEFEENVLKSLDKISAANNNGVWHNKVAMIDALQALKENNIEHWEITDAVRDNMIYGSSYRKNTNSGLREEEPTGDVVDKKGDLYYQELIAQFADLIKNGTGFDIRDSKHIFFSGNGGELLDRVINRSVDTQAGIIYNGDAVDAYFSNDNYQEVPDGSLRFIRPKVNLLLIDGLVITKGTDKKFKENALNIAMNTFLNGVDKNIAQWENDKNEIISKLSIIKDDNEAYQKYQYKSYEAYNGVCYTPAYKSIYEFAKNYYFADIEDEYEKKYTQNLYEIKSKYTIWKVGKPNEEYISEYEVKHIDIIPTNQKIKTEINTYYTSIIKG